MAAVDCLMKCVISAHNFIPYMSRHHHLLQHQTCVLAALTTCTCIMWCNMIPWPTQTSTVAILMAYSLDRYTRTVVHVYVYFVHPMAYFTAL